MVTDNMHMEPTLPAIAGTPASLDDLFAVVIGAGSPPPSADHLAADSADEREWADETEFWDACWTLEDEMIPRAVVRPDTRPRTIRTLGTASGFALL
jgi:hypothetical protein